MSRDGNQDIGVGQEYGGIDVTVEAEPAPVDQHGVKEGVIYILTAKIFTAKPYIAYHPEPLRVVVEFPNSL